MRWGGSSSNKLAIALFENQLTAKNAENLHHLQCVSCGGRLGKDTAEWLHQPPGQKRRLRQLLGDLSLWQDTVKEQLTCSVCLSFTWDSILFYWKYWHKSTDVFPHSKGSFYFITFVAFGLLYAAIWCYLLLSPLGNTLTSSLEDYFHLAWFLLQLIWIGFKLWRSLRYYLHLYQTTCRR